MPIPIPQINIKQALKGRNLYLIGMMGCGKSATGNPLAKQIGYGFVDADSVVEKVAGKSIQQIFAEDGEENFRLLESQVLISIGQRHSLVVATGGGVVMRSQNWGVLHQGIVIWLDVDRTRLINRLRSDKSQRPLLNMKNAESELDALLQLRQSFYSEADLRISVRDETPEDITHKIISNLPDLLIDPQDRGV